MSTINEQDLLNEIRFDIKNKDLLKGKLVLASLENVTRETQKQALFEVSKADDDFAIPLLVSVISKSPKISSSFPQLRETMFSRILDNPDILMRLLPEADDSSIKTFLVEIAGEIRLKKALPLLTEMLNRESEIILIKSIIISLGMIGDPSSVTAVAEYLYSSNNELIVSAAHTLGEIATPESVKNLASRLGNDDELDMIIIDIIAKIQIPQALQTLNDLLSSKHAHLRVAVKQKIGEIGAMSVRLLTKNLLLNNSDLIIHSLNVLGDIGDPAAIPAIRNLLYGNPKNPNVRFAAYEALGRLPLDKGAFTLASGLEDPVENVRSAAAKAIDKNYNSVLAGGVRNIIRSGDPTALTIISTIIDSLCGKIFLDLIEDDIFMAPALKYLSGNAHPDVRLHFAKILEEVGHKDLSKQLRIDEKIKAITKLKIFAVDDSKMILNIYRAVLHNLGYDSRLFEFPAEALKQIRIERPDVVLTDLNMPELTGIDLTTTIRQYFSKETLPIIMVTTQDEASDNEAAYKAGVNDILQKPFTESIIKTALLKFTGSSL